MRACVRYLRYQFKIATCSVYMLIALFSFAGHVQPDPCIPEREEATNKSHFFCKSWDCLRHKSRSMFCALALSARRLALFRRSDKKWQRRFLLLFIPSFSASRAIADSALALNSSRSASCLRSFIEFGQYNNTSYTLNGVGGEANTYINIYIERIKKFLQEKVSNEWGNHWSEVLCQK